MRQSSDSHSSMFLMELIIAIMFFSLAGAICLRLFTKSHQISEASRDLNMAVTQVESMAGLLKQAAKSGSGADAFAALLGQEFPDASQEGDVFYVYYDGDWEPCAADGCAYLVEVAPSEGGPQLDAYSITARKAADAPTEDPIYEITLELHAQQSP